MKAFFVAAALATAATPLTAAHAVVPIHAYEFDTDASDSAGSADGILLNGASVSGGMLVLDGADDYVQFATKLVPLTGDWSVFIRVDGTPDLSRFTEIISQGFSGGTGFYIGTQPGGNFRLSDTLGTGIVFPTGMSELLVTKGIGGTKLYINGTEVFSAGVQAASGPGGTNTRFGRQFEPIATEGFRGSIDAIRIYGSVILPGDVNQPVSGIPEPSSWAMLLFGFGVTGAMLRQRRTRVSA